MQPVLSYLAGGERPARPQDLSRAPGRADRLRGARARPRLAVRPLRAPRRAARAGLLLRSAPWSRRERARSALHVAPASTRRRGFCPSAVSWGCSTGSTRAVSMPCIPPDRPLPHRAGPGVSLAQGLLQLGSAPWACFRRASRASAAACPSSAGGTGACRAGWMSPCAGSSTCCSDSFCLAIFSMSAPALASLHRQRLQPSGRREDALVLHEDRDGGRGGAGRAGRGFAAGERRLVSLPLSLRRPAWPLLLGLAFARGASRATRRAARIAASATASAWRACPSRAARASSAPSARAAWTAWPPVRRPTRWRWQARSASSAPCTLPRQCS